MLDPLMRRLIDPPLNKAAGYWPSVITANQITIIGFGLGVISVAAVAHGAFTLALALLLINRLGDGLDGAVARASGQTDFGGYLDLVVDFIFYSAMPLAFAIANPDHAIAACFLCVSFMGTASSFLGVAILAAKHNIKTDIRGKKAFYYLGGLTEGFETILLLCAMALWPNYFAYLAWGFGLLCWVTTGTRIYMAHSMFAAR